MNSGSSERLDRIERVLEDIAARQQQLTELVVQTAERRSTSEHQIEWLSEAIGRLEKVVEIDAENIRRLANIAASHDARLDSHDSRLDGLEGSETG